MHIPMDDRAAIQDLAGLYAFFCDTHQFSRVADLFSDDCIYDESCTGVERVNGKADLLRTFDYFAEQLGPVMHTCSNHLISDYSGDQARGTCYVWAEGARSAAGGNTPIRVLGYYDDIYIKTNGHWYFKERVLRLLVPQPSPPGDSIAYDTSPRRFASRPQD